MGEVKTWFYIASAVAAGVFVGGFCLAIADLMVYLIFGHV